MFLATRVRSVKRLQATIAVLVFCMVFLSSITFPIDDPKTSYDESESPLTLITPIEVSTFADIHLMQVRGTVAMLRKQRGLLNVRAMNGAIVENSDLCPPPDSRFKLLCALLC
jgi:hypothetical protein